MLNVPGAVDIQLDERKNWLGKQKWKVEGKNSIFFFIQSHRKNVFQSHNISYQSWRVSRLTEEKQKIPMKNNSIQPILYYEVKHPTFSPELQKKGWKIGGAL